MLKENPNIYPKFKKEEVHTLQNIRRQQNKQNFACKHKNK